ncbi:hypothetical protein WA026_019253 [Henosepilachna vigintioctopunctata]|uniref:Uncharacterized protein n=1 Tax=Henosepilachna vigintioctopunctata TaxID=420089 RepID=A0AAW1UAE5_9CUCU
MDMDPQERDSENGQVTFPNIANMLPLQDRFSLPALFPFPHPAAAFLPSIPHPQPIAPSSGGSHSSEESALSQHTLRENKELKKYREVLKTRVASLEEEERDSENGEESPVSQSDEEMSDGEDSGREHDEVGSCDDINGGGDDRIRNNILAEHGDVLS